MPPIMYGVRYFSRENIFGGLLADTLGLGGGNGAGGLRPAPQRRAPSSTHARRTDARRPGRPARAWPSSIPPSASVGGALGVLGTPCGRVCWLPFALPTVSACCCMISCRRCSPTVQRHQGRHCRIFSYFFSGVRLRCERLPVAVGSIEGGPWWFFWERARVARSRSPRRGGRRGRGSIGQRSVSNSTRRSDLYFHVETSGASPECMPIAFAASLPPRPGAEVRLRLGTAFIEHVADLWP